MKLTSEGHLVAATPGSSAAIEQPTEIARPLFSATVTWLHLSDLHFRTSQTYDANVVLRALLRDVGERILMV